MFYALDKDGDGTITVEEMQEGISKMGIDMPADLKAIMKEVDSDGSGVIDYTEFLAATLDKKQYIQEDVCWSAFRLFDKNGDGKISKQELDQVLNQGDIEAAMGAKAVAELMAQVDTNGDGEIDFQEFMAMMKSDTSGNIAAAGEAN